MSENNTGELQETANDALKKSLEENEKLNKENETLKQELRFEFIST